MDQLCDSLEFINIQDNNDNTHENDPIMISIKHDIVHLLRAHEWATCHQQSNVYLLPRQLTNLATKQSFLSRFSTEAAFYKEIELRLMRHIPSSFLLDMMPLIDEYIEHVYNMFIL
jgi:hypothetical protein